jgi:hypothetical protein
MTGLGWLVAGAVTGLALGLAAHHAWKKAVDGRLTAFLNGYSAAVRTQLEDDAFDQHVADALAICGDDHEPPGIYDAANERWAARFRNQLDDADAVQAFLTGRGRA